MDTITFNFDAKSIRIAILSIFNHLNNLKDFPKKIICFLPSLNSNYFYDSVSHIFFEYDFIKLERNKNYIAPYNYTKLIGLDFIYYYNLNDIAMLEVFCKVANIELEWTVKGQLLENINATITTNFERYFKNENY